MPYRGFRFWAEIISHAVWLYHRSPLSFREVEVLLPAPGIIVFHGTTRLGVTGSARSTAAALRRRRP
ncbi:hypothetical protein [Streptomyces sp. IB2014 016-6]|uniref:hypothetical protein n=1 Tax=Streptomyces sp. IB2014 016-6 TaxID=2517818 RepID=UPI0011C7A33E|nr:hypothetical protein [Streptomyces sp. IB2014 016-6]TXL83595.1 hypothetical protein EW053_36990 [Streptomyces sp. IB2014 016-6]